MTDASPTPGPDGAEPTGSRSVPSRHRSVYERPLFWLGLVGGGVLLAVGLSLVAEKTDLSGRAGDVGHYCQQVAVIKRTVPLSLEAAASGGAEQAVVFVEELRTLEGVAPSNVKDDVREVRQAAEQVLAAVQTTDRSDPKAAGALLAAVAQAEQRSEDAFNSMTEYTQEACGVDLAPTTATTG